MDKIKRRFIYIICLLISILLVGCGQKSDSGIIIIPDDKNKILSENIFTPELDDAKSVELNVWGPWGNFEALDQVAIDFETYYPQVEIVYNSLTNVNDDLTNMFISGKRVDLYATKWLSSDDDSQSALFDYAYDFNESDISLDNINDKLLLTGNFEGKQLFIPLYQNIYGLVVNKAILSENNIQLPTNYNEFMDSCNKLTENGYEHPILAPDLYTIGAMNLIMRRIQYLAPDSRIYSELIQGNDTTDIFESSLDVYDEFEEKGYLDHQSDDFDDQYNAVIMKFFEGDIPYVMFPSDYYSGTKKREAKSLSYTENPFDYTFIALPFAYDGVDAYMPSLSSFYIAVNKDSDNVEYAKEFVRFMLKDEQMQTMARIKNMPVSTENTGLVSLKNIESLSSSDKIYASDIKDYKLLEKSIYSVLETYKPGITSHEEVLKQYSEMMKR